MSLANKPCYPIKTINLEKETETHHLGLTFKERLVIALASNPKLIYEENHITSKLIDTHQTAMNINKQAEAIIKLLENK